ncbi:hypothetical protein DPMN_021409 [Dreissena polymorpha]|uniref:A-kinase anchor protein 7-like phosphoesterase domain-containing protein n=1 Tax=Dreissena polymorpha TaxID=45954 RepID=A0A9D4SB02_DREPO|nr:hypothetical protein DPMN_021409 [Dreissena polymorpha]
MGYRCSHFVCVKIGDQSLKRELERMQDLIVDRYPDYDTFRIPSRSFHITVVDIMSLRGESDMKR